VGIQITRPGFMRTMGGDTKKHEHIIVSNAITSYIANGIKTSSNKYFGVVCNSTSILSCTNADEFIVTQHISPMAA